MAKSKLKVLFDTLFFKEEEHLRAKLDEQVWQRTRLYMLCTSILVAVWGVFDFYIDYENLKFFLALRALYTPITLLIVFNFHKPIFRRHHRRWAHIHYAALIVDVGIMVLWTDHFVKYLIGFSTIFWGASVLMLWRFWHTVLPGVVVIGIALVRFVWLPHNVHPSELITGIYYFSTCLTFTSFISGYGYWSAYKMTQQALSLHAAQSRLIQAEKTQSLNLVVASVAHELNTPIGIAVSATSNADQKIKTLLNNLDLGEITLDLLEDPAKDARISLTSALSSLSRTAELVNRFKQTAVDQSSEQQREFALVDYIKNNIVDVGLKPLLRRNGARVDIQGDNDIIIMSYPGAISQIITNLIVNSTIHAFKGTTDKQIFIRVSQQGNDVVIDYRDNGNGVPCAIADKIFDPFFTTSEMGQPGDGLGLSIVFNIVNELLGGNIKLLQDGDGVAGAHFAVQFPLTKT